MTNIPSIKFIQEQIVQGDKKMLSLLYRQYNGKLKLYGRQLTSEENWGFLEDIVQELFIWIAKNNHKLEHIENLEAYLFNAFRNNLYHKISRNKKLQQSHQKYITYSQNFDAFEEPSLEGKYILMESRQLKKDWVEKQLNQLSPKQKEVLYLKYFINLNYKEIAHIMNVTEQVARNYAYRGIQKLRRINEQEDAGVFGKIS